MVRARIPQIAALAAPVVMDLMGSPVMRMALDGVVLNWRQQRRSNIQSVLGSQFRLLVRVADRRIRRDIKTHLGRPLDVTVVPSAGQCIVEVHEPAPRDSAEQTPRR
jgi:hypothetical protein